MNVFTPFRPRPWVTIGVIALAWLAAAVSYALVSDVDCDDKSARYLYAAICGAVTLAALILTAAFSRRQLWWFAPVVIWFALIGVFLSDSSRPPFSLENGICVTYV